jgi:hypothetical protein
MREANEIARDAQRPWIAIRFEPKLVKTTHNSVLVEVDVLAENVGQTPAVDYHLFCKIFYVDGQEGVDAINGWLEDCMLKIKQNRKIIVPSSTDRFPYFAGTANLKFDATSTIIIIAASVIYKTGKESKRWEKIDKADHIMWRDGERFSAVYPLGIETTYSEGLDTQSFTSAPLSAYWTENDEGGA